MCILKQTRVLKCNEVLTFRMLCIRSSRGKISRDQTKVKETANLEMIWNFLTSASLELDNCSVDQQRPCGFMRRRPLRLFLVLQISLHTPVFRLETSQQPYCTSTFVPSPSRSRSPLFFFKREGRGGGTHAEATAFSLANNYSQTEKNRQV